MQVIAIERGYDGICVREPDAIDPYTGKPQMFDMPDGATGSWFVEVDQHGDPLQELAPKPRPDSTPPGAGPKPGSQIKVR